MNERIEKHSLRAKLPFEPGYIPPYPFPTIVFKDRIWAICPLCNRLTTLRTCYSCKVIMCEDCWRQALKPITEEDYEAE